MNVLRDWRAQWVLVLLVGVWIWALAKQLDAPRVDDCRGEAELVRLRAASVPVYVDPDAFRVAAPHHVDCHTTFQPVRHGVLTNFPCEGGRIAVVNTQDGQNIICLCNDGEMGVNWNHYEPTEIGDGL